MNKFKSILFLTLICVIFNDTNIISQTKSTQKSPKEMTNQDWKNKLSPEQFHILREKGTEYPHTGKFNLHFEKGNYYCAGCDALLFESTQKFESSCGWPSFDDAVKDAIEYKVDKSHFMVRTEIVCKKCGGHLGHLFDDEPTKTGQRYCVNSVSLDFKKE